jgi:hypothetical protein
MNIIMAFPAKPLNIERFFVIVMVGFDNRIAAHFTGLLFEYPVSQGLPNFITGAAFQIVSLTVSPGVHDAALPRFFLMFGPPCLFPLRSASFCRIIHADFPNKIPRSF